MTMDGPFALGGAAPGEEITDRLLDALAAGDQGAVERLLAAAQAERPEAAAPGAPAGAETGASGSAGLDFGVAAGLASGVAAARASQRALAVRSSAETRARHLHALMEEAARLGPTAPVGGRPLGRQLAPGT
ncbi:MAG: hypothetical protein ACRDJU_14520, partial [Actinomycetota bacterium]